MPRAARGSSRRKAALGNDDLALTTNLVDVYVSYLRRKVDAPGEEKLIRTVRGAGYALREA